MSVRDVLAGTDLDRFRDGDETLFRLLVDDLSPRLLAFALPFAEDADDAHDLVQETWQRVFHARRSYAGTGTLIGWILAVSRSVCLNAVKRRSARKTRPTHATIGDEPARPDELLEGDEVRRTLHLAVMDLPPRERDVVWLRFLHQLSTRETAEQLGCAEGTVKATLNHAMKKLHTAMQVRTT